MTGPPTALPPRRLVAAALSAVVLVLAAACDPQGDDDVATGCEAAVREASLASEVAEQVRLLDAALVACRSYAAFTGELARYPGIVGYDISTFVALRCDRVTDDAVRTAPTCAAVIDPTTTLPPTTLPDVVFVGDTLDGRPIEIRPSAAVQFVGEVPATVQQTVDIALESGCEGVLAQRDLWATRIGDPETGDEASVYAQHAQNVANYIQCESEPLDLAALGL
ncbi:MAG: hypothetical protein QNJ12_19435 [Ilumatobacter sp.]|uniref:hypothetical protein n=1 Tax=Ilumatobacter sp. TaxID=1967498 RepID=UPI002634604F|nr:hypothetical protein [Ilumatobacter sp.]MDJ0770974.1 hypothetical protein [Ilumatobacter sp.]